MSFKLQWQPSDKAEEQEVYRDTQPIPNEPAYAPLAALSSSDTEYTDTTPEAFTRYYYRVAAVRRQFGLERSLSDQVAIGYESGPSLDLGFTDQEYAILDGAGVLQPSAFGALLNFSRASVATYIDANGILQTAAANQPRFTYKDGIAQGLLIEGEATNIILNSNVPDSFNPDTAPTFTQNTTEVVDPMGGFSATKVEFTQAGTASLRFGVPVAGDDGIRKAASAYLRFSGLQKTVSINCEDNASADFPVGSDTWVRVQAKSTTNVGFYGYFDIENFSVSPGDVLYLWCGQLEAGSVATSPIPTNGAQATRAADVCSRTLGAEYRADEGAWFIDFDRENTGDDAFPLSVHGTNGNRISLYRSLTSLFLEIHKDGSPIGLTSVSTTSEKIKCAFSMQGGEFVFCVNGVTQNLTVSGPLPSLTDVRLGSFNEPGFSYPLQGTIAETAYIPRALSEAELIALTT